MRGSRSAGPDKAITREFALIRWVRKLFQGGRMGNGLFVILYIAIVVLEIAGVWKDLH